MTDQSHNIGSNYSSGVESTSSTISSGRDQKIAGRDIVEVGNTTVDVTVAPPSSAASLAELEQALKRNRASLDWHEDKIRGLLVADKAAEDLEVSAAIRNAAVAIRSIELLVPAIALRGGDASFQASESQSPTERLNAVVEEGQLECQRRNAEQRRIREEQDQALKEYYGIIGLLVASFIALPVVGWYYLDEFLAWLALDFEGRLIYSIAALGASIIVAVILVWIAYHVTIAVIASAPKADTQNMNRRHALWYVSIKGVQHGPLTREGIIRGIQSGKISQADYLFRKGFTNWQQVATVSELSGTMGFQGVRNHSKGVVTWS